MARRLLLAVVAACVAGSLAVANELPPQLWTLTPSEETLPKVEFIKAPNGLPDGGVAVPESESNVAAAWYTKPTKRYRHAILGDDIEAGELTVALPDGSALTYTLPDNQVFEDRTPRLIDLSLNGQTNIITILSDVDHGAALAVFGVVDSEIKLIAQTPFIGRTNRWRNIAGIADFDGDGNLQIAEVITPHIGGTLQLWTWKKNQLVASGSMKGFSNHFIGSREQDLSLVEDFNDDGVDDLALPDARRTALRFVSFSGRANGTKSLNEIANLPLPGQISTKIFGERDGDKIKLRFGLDNGSRWVVHQ